MVRGYYKTESGTLEIVDLDLYQGRIFTRIEELKATDEKETLIGWPDSEVEVWRGELSGHCYYVPVSVSRETMEAR